MCLCVTEHRTLCGLQHNNKICQNNLNNIVSLEGYMTSCPLYHITCSYLLRTTCMPGLKYADVRTFSFYKYQLCVRNGVCMVFVCTHCLYTWPLGCNTLQSFSKIFFFKSSVIVHFKQSSSGRHSFIPASNPV